MSWIAIDCEMVGDSGNRAMLAKVSLVDRDLDVIYDTFVRPTSPVVYYRDTGFSESQLKNGKPFNQVQNEVRNHLRGKVLIGHSVNADLSALNLTHSPVKDIADHYKKNNQRRSLKELAWEIIGERVQTGQYHDSIEDATTAMKIYKKNPF